MTEPSQPPADPTEPKPPRKWLGRRGGLIILAGFAAFWLYDLLIDTLVKHSRSPSPTVIVLGGFALAAALIYTMAYRVRPRDGISVSRLLIAFLLGGLISTTIASTANWLIDHATAGAASRPGLVALSLAGVVEEFCKILAVVIVSRGLAKKNARNGLFIGGAVGLGFSAIEDMGYQLHAWDVPVFVHSPLASLIGVSIGRDIIGPMEHPVFTALFAAALFAATRGGRYRITLGVVGTYLALAVVHGLIDSTGSYVYAWTGRPSLGDLGDFVATVGLTVASGIAWIRISRRIRDRTLAAEALEDATALEDAGALDDARARPETEPSPDAVPTAGATDR